MLPGPVRLLLLRSLRVELTASTAYAGPPSVAHVEALLRSIESRSATLDEPVETIVVPVPRTTPYLPRERPNPLIAANLALGHALRLWRDAFPVAQGGTVILAHRFHRAFAHPTQAPYRAFFAATRLAREPEIIAAAEREARADERALAHYRAGRSCHPALPFADWDACRPALKRVGMVLVAGCRDATAARQLGFVPTGSISARSRWHRARSAGSRGWACWLRRRTSRSAWAARAALRSRRGSRAPTACRAGTSCPSRGRRCRR